MFRKILFFISFVLLFFPNVHVKANSGEQQVEVIDLGKNEEEAKKQAYRNAVQSVVGTMVKSETLIKNEELVEDKILSHSDGYVTKAEQIGKAKIVDGGLTEVKMSITVESQQLKEKLQAENITEESLSDESLFAKVVSKQESNKNATEIVERMN